MKEIKRIHKLLTVMLWVAGALSAQAHG